MSKPEENHFYCYHIAFASPLGFGTYFYRGKEHPLMPDTYKEKTASLASKMSLASGRNITPDMMAYITLTELPLCVINARWPVGPVEDD
jgi:hypothetical protein